MEIHPKLIYFLLGLPRNGLQVVFQVRLSPTKNNNKNILFISELIQVKTIMESDPKKELGQISNADEAEHPRRLETAKTVPYSGTFMV